MTLHKVELGWEIEKEAKPWRKSGEGCWEIKRMQKKKRNGRDNIGGKALEDGRRGDTGRKGG